MNKGERKREGEREREREKRGGGGGEREFIRTLEKDGKIRRFFVIENALTIIRYLR